MPAFKRRKTEEIIQELKVPPINPKALRVNPNLEAVMYYEPVLEEMMKSSDNLVAPLIPLPRADDWLACHAERGQSFKSFFNMVYRAVPHAAFSTVAVVILGSGLSQQGLSFLSAYISAFYQLRVETIGPIDIDPFIKDGTIRSRINEWTGKRQLFVSGCLDVVSAAIKKNRSISSRTCVSIGVTMEDLTKNEEFNFVYGLASITDGVGMFSIARFSPEFNGERVASEQEAQSIVTLRMCKVVCHELGHLFGLKHCVYFRCLMNGANHVEELNRQRLVECPCCTKKLLLAFSWDLCQRYTQMAAAMKKLGLTDAAKEVEDGVLKCVSSAQLGKKPPLCVGHAYVM